MLALGIGYTSYKNENEILFVKNESASFPVQEAESMAVLDEPLVININTATSDELKKLDGVGEVLAESIIEYRQNNGPFCNIEDIMNVKGIGKNTFEEIKDGIVVE